jgi:hypothetical protein
MSEGALLIGVLAVILAFIGLVYMYRTVLLGMTVLNVFAVGTASLSAFLVAKAFDLPMYWFTDAHAEVVEYMIFGMLAMALGIALAWRPLFTAARSLRGRAMFIPRPAHFSERIAWVSIALGMAAESALPFVYSFPTVSTATSCLASLARVGLCILLINTFHTRRWTRFFVALALYTAVSIAGSMASGFTFIRINAFVPLGAIWLVSVGFKMRSVIAFLGVGVAAVSGVSAWLGSRDLIRSGALEALPLSQKIATFFSTYMDTLSLPNADMLFDTIIERVDMTAILAAQVVHQPVIEPYAHGDTVLSALYTLIPRILWQDKPQVAGGSSFVAQYSGLWRPIDDTTSVGMPYPFELFANGGPLLVIAGLAIIGYVGARLELRMAMPQKSLGAFWSLALVVAVMSEGGQRTDVVLPAMVASALSAYAMGWLAQRFLRIDEEFEQPQPKTDALSLQADALERHRQHFR